MKIILLESIRGLGDPGDIVNVKSGYARNYLIPHDLATYANKGNINKIEYQIKKSKEIEEKKKIELQDIADKLNKISLKFELETGQEEKLFGSVTTQMIINQLSDSGFNIEKKDLVIPEPIKTIGTHYVNVYLHKDIHAKIKVKVKTTKA